MFTGHLKRYYVSALEVLRNRALQIDIYLLTYLLTYIVSVEPSSLLADSCSVVDMNISNISN